MQTRTSSFRLFATPILIATALYGCRSSLAPDDTALNSAIQRKLANDTAISAEPVQSSVQSGVAILQGNVSSEAARALAASDASQVSGVRSVVNQLTVWSGPQPSPPAMSSIAPAPISSLATRGQKPSAVVTPRRSPPPFPTQTSRNDVPDQSVPIERRSPLQDQTAEPSPQLERRAEVLPAPPPSAPRFRNIIIPTGTTLPIRITQTLDSATAQQGDTSPVHL